MIMKNFFTLFFIMTILSAGTFCNGQKFHKIDSLRSELKKAKRNSDKANTLGNLVHEFRDADPQKALYFANAALALSIKTNNKMEMAEAYRRIGKAMINL